MFAADYYFCLDDGDCVVVVGMRFTVTIKSRVDCLECQMLGTLGCILAFYFVRHFTSVCSHSDPGLGFGGWRAGGASSGEG